MKTEKYDSVVLASKGEKEILKQLTGYFKSSPLPEDEILPNLGLFLTSKSLSRILFFHEIYKKIIHTHGVVMEFGVRWGQTLSILSALRSMFEPFNRHRKIVGFDTFQGLKGVTKTDGELSKCADGSFGVSPNYEDYLDKILSIQEQLNPIPHLKKYEIVKGDSAKTIPDYFKKHPETLISLAVLDFDIYKPTKAALERIKSRLFKGSILVFDELCDDVFPGETIALMETMDLKNLRIKRFPMTARVSYVEIE